MQLAAKLDSYGKPAWIATMVVGFIIFWPIGLAILGFLIWSGRMGYWKQCKRGRWHNERHEQGHRDKWFGGASRRDSSGNTAFDEYREEALRRLEEEEKEFHEFLNRLRHAKDKAEFDQFMTDRRRNPRPEEGSEANANPA